MSLMESKIEDDLLAGMEAEIERRITDPKVKEAYDRTVNAGMMVVQNQGAKGLQAIMNAEDKVSACALGAANLVLLMWKQSNGTMPFEVIPPSSLTLMLQAMDLLDKSGRLEASKENVVRGTSIAMNRVLAATGISQEMLGKMATKVQSIMQDPLQMEAINRRAGVVKDPRASSPTVPMEEAAAPAPTEEEEAANG